MNNEVFALLGRLGVDTSDADNSIDKTTKNAEKNTDKIAGYFKKAAVMIGTVFAVDKIIDFGKASVEAAAAAQAVQSQFEQVFGELGPQAKDTLNGMADTFGMLPNRLKGALTTTTSMFKGLGLNTEDALKQASSAVTLAADAAAFYDKSYEDANSALNSFIKGNYEGGESIGLFANETQLAKYAANELGLEWSKLGEADKQMARLSYAQTMQEAAGATGQAARESDTYANQVGNMKQAWTDFKVMVGQPIMGVVIDGLKNVTQWLIQAGEKVQAFTAWAKENETTMMILGVALGTITALIIAYNIQQALATAGTTLWGAIAGGATVVTTALGAAFTFLTSPIGLVILAIGAVIAIGVLLWKNWDTITQKVGELWNNIKAKFAAIGQAIMDPVEKAKNFIKDMIEKIKGFFNFKWELPKLKMPHVTIKGSFSLLPPKVPTFGIDWYKDGGIMTAPTLFGMNGMRGMVGGEAGDEAILPLNRETLGSIGDGIVQSTGFNDALADKVDTLIELVRTMVNNDPQYQMILDTGVLAGELTPIINKNMGRETERKKRGG